jgi:homoserine/homoserine lactone efflux protein
MSSIVLFESSDIVFLWVSFLVTFTPGPSILYALTQGAKNGFVNSIPGIAGNISASICYALITISGGGLFLASHKYYLKALSYPGSLYLIFMGMIFIFAKKHAQLVEIDHSGMPCSTKNIIKNYFAGFVVNISNPKILLFYIIIIPQFIINSKSVLFSLIKLTLIQNFMKLISLLFYTGLANQLNKTIIVKNAMLCRKISGFFIVIAGCFLLVDVYQY